MEEYVALERRWVSVPDMPRGVYAAGAVALDGKLLVIGGRGRGLLSAVLEYNPEDRSWKDLPSLLTARAECAAAVFGGDAVVMGGFAIIGDDEYSEYCCTSVERYNRRLQCWEAMPSLDTNRWALAAVVFQG